MMFLFCFSPIVFIYTLNWMMIAPWIVVFFSNLMEERAPMWCFFTLFVIFAVHKRYFSAFLVSFVAIFFLLMLKPLMKEGWQYRCWLGGINPILHRGNRVEREVTTCSWSYLGISWVIKNVKFWRHFDKQDVLKNPVQFFKIWIVFYQLHFHGGISLQGTLMSPWLVLFLLINIITKEKVYFR